MTSREIRKMQKVCKLATQTLDLVATLITPNISTLEINDIIHNHIISVGAMPAPLNYHGFPKSICTSVNDMVCHGVPRADEILKVGDIINVDVTLIKDGFYGDTSRTFFVGEVSEEAKLVTKVAKEAMHAGISAVKAGINTNEIGDATEKIVKQNGLHVVRDIGGHGIGDAFHLDPFVPGCRLPGRGEVLRNNTCITVEPMINIGSHKHKSTAIENSSITEVRTTDGKLSAQFEHTILITKTGYEILTLSEGKYV